MKNVAFCFLLYDTVKHSKTWENFFKDDKNNSHAIYTHLKTVTNKTQKWVRKNRIRSVKTEYCGVSLVYAWIQLLKNALKNRNNKYFVLLSGECIPLFPYKKVYRRITASKKSRLNATTSAEVYDETGLYWADQWCILNRKHAKLLVKLRTTKRGKQFVKYIMRKIDMFCPDEIIPVNWFTKHYGKISSSSFNKEFRRIPSTYTYWDGKSYQPVKFTYPLMNKMKKKICSSKALFGRKFYGKAGEKLAMNC